MSENDVYNTYNIVLNYLLCYCVCIIDAQGKGVGKLVWLLLHAKKVVILVILYSISNLAAYYALARIDAAMYAVLLQVLLDSLCCTSI